MSYPCTRMTVTAMGLDRENNVFSAQNGNYGEPMYDKSISGLGRPRKLISGCTGMEGNCGCTHAEDRLLKMVPNPWYVILSHSPCLACAKLLVEAGVEVVRYVKEYRITDGIEYLLSNHVEVIDDTKRTSTHIPKEPLNYVKIEGSFEL